MNDANSENLPSTFDDGDVYDLVADQIPYGLDFYVGLARKADGPVLDVACGTGRILLPCLQAGVDIEGLDLFEPMLAKLRAKAAALNLSPRLHQSDMSDFSLPRRYALVMVPFNAFIHNMTQEAQISCLQRCREHLLPAGKLVFDTFFPSLEIIGAPAKHARAGRGDAASADRIADADVRYAPLRPRRADATLVERIGNAGRRRQRRGGPPFRSQFPLHLQARNGAVAARRRLRPLGNSRRLRWPSVDARGRRHGRHGLERVTVSRVLIGDGQRLDLDPQGRVRKRRHTNPGCRRSRIRREVAAQGACDGRGVLGGKVDDVDPQ